MILVAEIPFNFIPGEILNSCSPLDKIGIRLGNSKAPKKFRHHFLFCTLCQLLDPKEKIQNKDEVYILADHARQDVKKDMVWAWGKVKINMENSTIQADKVKVNNKSDAPLLWFCSGCCHPTFLFAQQCQTYLKNIC